MARCRPCSILYSLSPPEQIDRGANNSWGVPDVLYDPQSLNNFLPGSRKVWALSPSSGRAPRAPEGSGPGRDLLQQCLWAAGITEQLLEAEARREPPAQQGQLFLQPSVQQPGPCPALQAGTGPAQAGPQAVRARAAPHVVLLQQVPQRIILQVKQPAPTTVALLPSPAPCVLGSGQGPGPPAHPGHPPAVTVSHPGAAAAPQHGTAVGIELWHAESFWGLEPQWGNLGSFVSYF